jgi:transcriptional regulator with GAF, ATPase, and Fis domain
LSERIVASAEAATIDGAGPATLAAMVAEFERARIVEQLAACNGNKSEAARRFGLTYRGLLAKMQRLGLVS